MMPDLYLSLEVRADSPERLEELPEGFADLPMVQALQSPVFDGPGWLRTWRAFSDRAQAIAYSEANPTIVLIPLEPSELVPLGQVP
jgi:hypothetical protein